MAKYRVVFAISYGIEAKDMGEAEDKAIEQFEKELGDIAIQNPKLLELFGVNIEKLEEST